MRVAWGGYSPGKSIWLSDCCLCTNMYYITVIVPALKVLVADVFGTSIFRWTAQMKFLRLLLGLTRLDHQRNTTNREKLKVEHIVDEIWSYQKNWLHGKKDGTFTNTQDGTGIPTKRQTRHRSTKNKMERPTASSRSSFHWTRPRCPTSVYVHDDDDDFSLTSRAIKQVAASYPATPIHLFLSPLPPLQLSVYQNYTVLGSCTGLRGLHFWTWQ